MQCKKCMAGPHGQNYSGRSNRNLSDTVTTACTGKYLLNYHSSGQKNSRAAGSSINMDTFHTTSPVANTESENHVLNWHGKETKFSSRSPGVPCESQTHTHTPAYIYESNLQSVISKPPIRLIHPPPHPCEAPYNL